jgi:hypothetical protein
VFSAFYSAVSRCTCAFSACEAEIRDKNGVSVEANVSAKSSSLVPGGSITLLQAESEFTIMLIRG